MRKAYKVLMIICYLVITAWSCSLDEDMGIELSYNVNEIRSVCGSEIDSGQVVITSREVLSPLRNFGELSSPIPIDGDGVYLYRIGGPFAGLMNVDISIGAFSGEKVIRLEGSGTTVLELGEKGNPSSTQKLNVSLRFSNEGL